MQFRQHTAAVGKKKRTTTLSSASKVAPRGAVWENLVARKRGNPPHFFDVANLRLNLMASYFAEPPPPLGFQGGMMTTSGPCDCEQVCLEPRFACFTVSCAPFFFNDLLFSSARGDV